MTGLARHLPILLVIAAVCCVASCGHDEPGGKRPGNNGSIVNNDTTTRDTTGRVTPNDTTSRDTTGRDTTGASPSSTFTLKLSAERDYGYMGQTIQLHATTSADATVKWKSTNTMAATVNNEGLVLLANVRDDCETHIIATANNASDSILLHNRAWYTALKENGTWATGEHRKVHRGDTLAVTIVDQSLHLINDNSFNASACQWVPACYETDINTIMSAIEAPSQANGWQAKWVMAPGAPVNVTFTITAHYNGAASTLSFIVLP